MGNEKLSPTSHLLHLTSQPMHRFAKNFNILHYIIKHAAKILLFAHSGPDADTVGSVLALKSHLSQKGKLSEIACFDLFPEYLKPLGNESFVHPQNLEIRTYDAIIACDSVGRGFDKIKEKLAPEQVTVLIDHHPDITLQGDVTIIDPAYSSVCEIIYDYFENQGEEITKEIATFLMMGIVGDTGTFQHANTTPRVMKIASRLMLAGADLSKIVSFVFANKKISTLKLWGWAFEKARINPRTGMIVTVLTKEDLEGINSSSSDLGQVASILNTVPGAKFSLVLSEKENETIKGSLRSEEYKSVDVSQIAARFGGGGHKLASGFEIKGKIVETENGWKIV
jgi:bifunctional oligoribonuclease and PAP phosphatase NrnA